MTKIIYEKVNHLFHLVWSELIEKVLSSLGTLCKLCHLIVVLIISC